MTERPLTADAARVEAFVAGIRDDPRVVGVARTPDHPRGVPHLIVVCTWDGGESMPRELPRLCRPLVGGGSPIERVHTPEHPAARTVAVWNGVGADGSRASVLLRRVGDLVPSEEAKDAEALVDPHAILEQWIRYSRKAKFEECLERDLVSAFADRLLLADLDVREMGAGLSRWNWDPLDWTRDARRRVRMDDPAQAALAARIDSILRCEPGPAPGTRVTAGDDAAAAYESFLLVADGEGFKGDRMLFGEAVKRLRDLSGREPVFDQGFVVPTFDAVEAAFALGEAVGGCQPPLVPGVWVGVGVTPKDHLEFWAAPFVRDPTCTVACVDDTGERDVVERKAGRDPMVAALTDAVDAAWERLPELIDRARECSKESVDPAAALAPLHLPKSFVERCKRHGADALMCSRLTVALGVARAGHDCAPLVARKFGLAAGRVIARR